MVTPLPQTASDILLKVRRITKMPNQNQITDAQIYQYLNTYYLYDFPQELRLKSCLSNYTFQLIPYQESYRLPTDTIISIEPPLYINGYQSHFTQSQEKFYGLYPPLSIQNQPVAGDGTTGPYLIQLTPPPGVPMEGIFQGKVSVSVVNSTTGVESAAAVDVPNSTTTGRFFGTGLHPTTSSSIDYTTGAVTLNFANAIASTSSIIIWFVPYVPSRPSSMLFYNDTLYFRPVPDQAYLVNIQAYVNPFTAIMGALSNPPIGQTYTPAYGQGTTDTQYPQPPYVPPGATSQLAVGFQNPEDTAQVKQWWQLLALGAALLIFEDRGDFQQLAAYQERYDRQLRLVLRRTLVEMSNERTATIYSEQTGYGTAFGNYFGQF